MRKPVALIAIAVIALGAAACSSDDSSSTTTTTSSSGSGSSEQDLSVSTPEGQVTLSLDGNLPPGWPSGFPLPPRTTTAGSGSLSRSTSGQMVGVFSTKQSGTDAYDFYTGQSSLQPTDTRSAGIGSAFVGSMNIAGPDSGSVTVASLSGTTYIVVVLDTGGTSSSTTTSSSSSGSSTSTTAATTG